MSRFIFKSRGRKNVCYEYNSDTDYRRVAGVSLYVSEFDTYGDGMTQHSGACSVSFDHFPDFIASILDVLADDKQRDTALEAFNSSLWPCSDNGQRIRFVVENAKPGKYLCLREDKVSARKELQYDKRWVRIDDDFSSYVVADVYRLLHKRSNDDYGGISLDLHTWAEVWSIAHTPGTEGSCGAAKFFKMEIVPACNLDNTFHWIGSLIEGRRQMTRAVAAIKSMVEREREIAEEKPSC